MTKRALTVFIILIGIFISGSSYCQPTGAKTVKGTVTTVDSVGNIINVQTTDGGPMSFVVPEKARKLHDTHDIGLNDIKQGDPVIIQYDNPSPGQNTAISIVDNSPES